ncbi:MAG: 30S ribosomal protein S20 [Actinomycetota bacterium]|nr:30S ribosomal protein S20 [Actinomycetota bacterium]
MANIRSQIKRNRQNEERRLHNKAIRSEMRTRAKKALQAAEAGQREEALELLRLAQKRIDMASAQGILHRNTAARRKSQLTKQVEGLLG